MDAEQRAVLREMSNDRWKGFAGVADWSEVPIARVKLIVRQFAAEGLCWLSPMWSYNEGMLCGRGYFLTIAGVKALESMLSAVVTE